MLETSMNEDIHLTLSEPEHAAAREAYTLLCMYTAYLISTHDNECRRAFILLASAERLYHVVDRDGNVSYAQYTYPPSEGDRYSRRYDGNDGSRRARDAQLTEEKYNNNSGGRGRRGYRDVSADEERFVKYMREHEHDGYESDH